MLVSMVYTEMLKMKRTVLPWMIAAGGILPAGIALLTLTNGNSEVTWDMLAVSSLNYMNMTALLLTAVFTGLVFAGEYASNTVSVMFTYPVSRLGFFIAKHIILLLAVVSMYLLLFASTFAFGFTEMRSLPGGGFIVKFVEYALITAVLNFVSVPLTVLVCTLVRGVAASVVTGMCYVLIYMSFINSEYSLYIPACTPTRIVADSFASGGMHRADIPGVVSAAVIIFTVSFIVSGIYYGRADVQR